MPEKKKLKLKKFFFHPITMFLVGTILVMLISLILSSFEMQSTYNSITTNGKDLTSKLVVVENLFNYENLKYLISNTVKNFMGFSPLCMLLISLIGISIAKATGLIDIKVGYVILIPLAALVYEKNGRNPLLGVVTAFCGVAFGYGVSIFVGSQEVALIPYTKSAAHLIDSSAHISLTSNLIFIIVSSLLLPLIGTPIIEKLISPKLPKFHRHDKVTGKTLQTSELLLSDITDEEEKRIAFEKNSKRGLKYALIVSIIVILLFAYMIIPNLPGSGLLLDMTAKTYLDQLFGSTSYFQDGFTYMVAILFITTGLAYGIGAKTIKNDRDLIEKTSDIFKDLGMVLLMIFVFSQFITVWKQSNIGIVFTSWCANLLSHLEFDGIPLIVITIIIISISNFFCTSLNTKWMIFSPVVVPLFMQNNISPQFAQIIMRAGQSITAGISPFMVFFVIYLAYLNIYNQNKERPITIKQSISFVIPYFAITALAWILIIVLWYVAGIPIGPNIKPTI